MRAVLQRVSTAQVDVDGVITGTIATGLVVLLGIHHQDDETDLNWLVDKIHHLRIFDDDQGQMNLSLTDIQGELLVVSQFTLYGDCRKGRRPSWNNAAPPDQARCLYDLFIAACRQRGTSTRAGQFQANMQVTLTNSGPVTILLDSHKTF
ncbi:D-aminoacyl-tRNA deacylase [Desulfobulbus alkaliphilus]|uniref:D-aminoacyl-tRNA deacylase n=1 Tax=Desulfobulbus alkaliphilus TaxID=869814 RepID=UPI00196255AB|nr:D-aminoacyl-tRNA deacylase [Desulfobulbus alkaliphilus]MBM9536690.1 D-tyrosyl-tRNA(Tyr) deacylase [Desulfobulbus alkaliphilus]